MHCIKRMANQIFFLKIFHRKILCLPLLLNIFFLCLPNTATALPDDNQQPAAINADNALLNLKNNTRIFTGHVKVTQGSTQLTADKLITYGSKQKKLTQITAFGNPANYQTIPKPGDAIFYASADKIEYFANTGKVILIGNGLLHQGANSFKAPYITYDRKTGIVTSKQEKNQRTTIIIQPDTLSKAQVPTPKNPSKKS